MTTTGTTIEGARADERLTARDGTAPGPSSSRGSSPDDAADDTAGNGAPAADDDEVGRPTWLLVAFAVGAIALLGLAAWSLLRANDLATQRDDRRAAASVAGRYATAIMSYDHRDLEGSLAAVTDLATQDEAENYQNAYFEELQPVVDELRARGRVHVRDVYVSEIDDGTATAVVNFDAVIRSTIGTRRLTGSYVRIDLKKEGGEWKADELTFLATTQEGLDAPDGSSGAGAGTSPTTAPAGGG